MARRIRPRTAAAVRPAAVAQPGPAQPADLDGELVDVLAAWVSGGAHSPQTLARMSETVHRFARRLHALGVSSFVDVQPVDAWGFITAPVSGGQPAELATRHARRTALRTLYRTLRAMGRPVGDPTLDLALPPRGLLAARPLTDDEVTLCRAGAQLTRGRWASMRATAWALGEATAVSSEITAIALADLDDPASPQTVRLPGTRRHDPRTARLTGWGRRVVAERVQTLRSAGADASTLLAYGGHAPPGGAKAQASVCNALREVLDTAGLAAETDVRPSSLRHWAGRTAYDTGTPIEQVARLLGHRSLDATAEDIALSWRTPTPIPRPNRTERHRP